MPAAIHRRLGQLVTFHWRFMPGSVASDGTTSRWHGLSGLTKTPPPGRLKKKSSNPAAYFSNGPDAGGHGRLLRFSVRGDVMAAS
ncbi:hypothetical protein ABZ614_33490 [Streptomyces sp. NPDC013178]|uniref:hypothetical protein n=1 Tax=Streptomyces sp. NPDC013178 TaxID=3155118 RepID=UPI0033D3ED4F